MSSMRAQVVFTLPPTAVSQLQASEDGDPPPGTAANPFAVMRVRRSLRLGILRLALELLKIADLPSAFAACGAAGACRCCLLVMPKLPLGVSLQPVLLMRGVAPTVLKSDMCLASGVCALRGDPQYVAVQPVLPGPIALPARACIFRAACFCMNMARGSCMHVCFELFSVWNVCRSMPL